MMFYYKILYFMGGLYPGGDFPGGLFSSGAIVIGGDCPDTHKKITEESKRVRISEFL